MTRKKRFYKATIGCGFAEVAEAGGGLTEVDAGAAVEGVDMLAT